MLLSESSCSPKSPPRNSELCRHLIGLTNPIDSSVNRRFGKAMGNKNTEDPLERGPSGQQACKPDSVLCDHLSGKRVAAPLVQPTREPGEQPVNALLFGLAPGGVCLLYTSPSP